MKYNKKILLALAIVVVILLVALIIITKIKAEEKKEEEYNNLVKNLCTTAVDLSKTNVNAIELEKEVGKYAYVKLKDLSTMTIGKENRIPANLENPKLSKDSKPVYFSDSMAVKLVVDNQKQVICSELVDLGEPPKVNLKGSKEMVISLGEKYIEPGYTASDKEDGDLTSKVLKSGIPNPEVRGDYTIIYFLEDSMMNKTSEIRKISVK